MRIKDIFWQTNIRKDYEKRILDCNVNKFSLIIKDDMNIFVSIKIIILANKNVILQINSISGIKKLHKS